MKCKSDSVLMYNQIKYFYDEKTPCKDDTFSILGYSYILKEIEEPKIYNNKFDYEIIRFSWFKNTIPIFFRIEKKNDNISVTYKSTSGISDIIVGKILIDTTYNLSSKKYDKIINLLYKSNYWKMENHFIIMPRDILIECFLNGEYYFINKNFLEIKNDKIHRKLLKCFKFLPPN